MIITIILLYFLWLLFLLFVVLIWYIDNLFYCPLAVIIRNSSSWDGSFPYYDFVWWSIPLKIWFLFLESVTEPSVCCHSLSENSCCASRPLCSGALSACLTLFSYISTSLCFEEQNILQQKSVCRRKWCLFYGDYFKVK